MTQAGVKKVLIIGVGLIGSSCARALKATDDKPFVVGVDANKLNIDLGVDLGFLNEGIVVADADDNEAVGRWLQGDEAVDLIIIATPSRNVVQWLAVLGAYEYAGLVTDVASTKASIISAAESLLGPDASYVGGHPMTGSEKSGAGAGRGDLFNGAYWLLTPAHSTDAGEFVKIHNLVQAFGAHPIAVAPDEHDRAVAVISHLPHIAASALVDVAAAHAQQNKDLLRLAAGGFKDTTRVAAGSPEMWTSICLDNAEAIGDALADMRDVLRTWEVAIRTRDTQAISKFLTSSALVRQSLPAQWVPANEDLAILEVPMLDRPGVIAEITLAVSEAGCNIESIEIDHSTESTARLFIVLGKEGDKSRLLAHLVAVGYDPELKHLDVPIEVR